MLPATLWHTLVPDEILPNTIATNTILVNQKSDKHILLKEILSTKVSLDKCGQTVFHQKWFCRTKFHPTRFCHTCFSQTETCRTTIFSDYISSNKMLHNCRTVSNRTPSNQILLSRILSNRVLSNQVSPINSTKRLLTTRYIENAILKFRGCASAS